MECFFLFFSTGWKRQQAITLKVTNNLPSYPKEICVSQNQNWLSQNEISLPFKENFPPEMNIVLRIILNFWTPQNEKKNQVKIEDSYSYFMYKLLIVWIRSNKVGKSPATKENRT